MDSFLCCLGLHWHKDPPRQQVQGRCALSPSDCTGPGVILTLPTRNRGSERRIAQSNGAGTRERVSFPSAQGCALNLLQQVKTEVGPFPVFFKETPRSLLVVGPFDMNEGVSEVFLGLIFRTYSRSPKEVGGEGWKEREVWGRRKGP